MKFISLQLLLLHCIITFSQTIENVRPEKSGSHIKIYYDIVNAKQGQTFDISVQCISEGGVIDIISAQGDIGKGIIPGTNKLIIWDVFKDIHTLSIAEFVINVDEINEVILKSESDNEFLTPIEEVYYPAERHPVSDYVLLNNGKVKKGLVISNRYTATTFKLQYGEGSTITYDPAEIKRIQPLKKSIDTVIFKNGDIIVGRIIRILPNQHVDIKNYKNVKDQVPLNKIRKISTCNQQYVFKKKREDKKFLVFMGFPVGLSNKNGFKEGYNNDYTSASEYNSSYNAVIGIDVTLDYQLRKDMYLGLGYKIHNNVYKRINTKTYFIDGKFFLKNKDLNYYLFTQIGYHENSYNRNEEKTRNYKNGDIGINLTSGIGSILYSYPYFDLIGCIGFSLYPKLEVEYDRINETIYLNNAFIKIGFSF